MSSLHNRTVIRDDQHGDYDGHVTRAQRIFIEERWESLQPDGTPWTSAATREDVIFEHLRSNAHFADHAQWLVEHNHPKATEYEPGVPLARIRKVTRYETASVWEVASDVEDLDEMAEQLAVPSCLHPLEHRGTVPDGRGGDRPFCYRCAGYLDEKDSQD